MRLQKDDWKGLQCVSINVRSESRLSEQFPLRRECKWRANQGANPSAGYMVSTPSCCPDTSTNQHEDGFPSSWRHFCAGGVSNDNPRMAEGVSSIKQTPGFLKLDRYFAVFRMGENFSNPESGVIIERCQVLPSFTGVTSS